MERLRFRHRDVRRRGASQLSVVHRAATAAVWVKVWKSGREPLRSAVQPLPAREEVSLCLPVNMVRPNGRLNRKRQGCKFCGFIDLASWRNTREPEEIAKVARSIAHR